MVKGKDEHVFGIMMLPDIFYWKCWHEKSAFF